MKKINAVAVLACLLAAATIAASHAGKSQHDVVIIKTESYGIEGNAGFAYQGDRIWNSSSSSNAPELPKLVIGWPLPPYAQTQAAEEIAKLLNDDFVLTSTVQNNAGGLTMVFIRNR